MAAACYDWPAHTVRHTRKAPETAEAERFSIASTNMAAGESVVFVIRPSRVTVMKYNRTSIWRRMTLMSAIKTIMSAIKTIISVSPNWRKVLKQFRQTEVRCAIGASGDRQR